ncbi:MAG: hypothetical protein GWO81_00890 [Verrucomicrobia bacterium]|nr:hypothetical protein [Verrucomicrobiota bacterium]
MDNSLEHIARENFRSSGFITRPGSERRVPWSFTEVPRTPFTQTDAVRAIEARRAHAHERQNLPPNKILTFLNALFPR